MRTALTIVAVSVMFVALCVVLLVTGGWTAPRDFFEDHVT